MQLHRLRIKNFRKLQNVDIDLRETTFLIGANNAGKTSTLDAVEILLTLNKSLSVSDKSRYMSDGIEKEKEGDVIIEGEFRDVSKDVLTTRGFKPERLFCYDDAGITKYGFCYRVRLDSVGKTHREIYLKNLTLKEKYAKCNTLQEFVDAGADKGLFMGENLTKKISTKDKTILAEKYWDLCDYGEDVWIDNAGGIAQNINESITKILKGKSRCVRR